MFVGEKWRVESDELNVTLYKKRLNKKKGTEYWDAHSYYPTVKDALGGMIELEIKGDGLKDLLTVVQKIEELKSLIQALPN